MPVLLNMPCDVGGTATLFQQHLVWLRYKVLKVEADTWLAGKIQAIIIVKSLYVAVLSKKKGELVSYQKVSFSHLIQTQQFR